MAAATAHAGDAPQDEPVVTAPERVSLTLPRPDWNWAFAVYAGNWTNSRLPTFPVNLVRGKLTFDDARMVSFIASRHLLDFDVPVPWTRYQLSGFSLEAEAALSPHFGDERMLEASGGLVLRTGEIPLGSFAGLNFAWTNGLSYAFSDPTYEFGPGGKRGVDSRRFQYFMAFEAELTPASIPNVSAFFRLHHRSGMYGVISPQRTGSNYVGGGLRLRLP